MAKIESSSKAPISEELRKKTLHFMSDKTLDQILDGTEEMDPDGDDRELKEYLTDLYLDKIEERQEKKDDVPDLDKALKEKDVMEARLNTQVAAFTTENEGEPIEAVADKIEEIKGNPALQKALGEYYNIEIVLINKVDGAIKDPALENFKKGLDDIDAKLRKNGEI